MAISADPTLVPPPSVQNYHRYSPDDQRGFSIKSDGFQYVYYPLPKALKPRQLKPGAVVFGWHPYWMGNAYVNYDFSLLTHVAYYGYQATDQGALVPEAPPGQGPENLVAAARRHNPACKVLLTIAYPGAEGATSLLDANRQPAQEALLAAIVQAVVNAKADGVNLDFCPPDQKPQLLDQLKLQLAQQRDTLLARQTKLKAGAQKLGDQQAALLPSPNSLVRLGNQKDELTNTARSIREAQSNLNQQLQDHHKTAPRRPPPHGFVWGHVARLFKLDKTANEQFIKDSTKYALAERALNVQAEALNVRADTTRQRLLRNASLARRLVLRQASQQPLVAAGVGQLSQNLARNEDLQTINRLALAERKQAANGLPQRASTYRYVVPPSMLPLTNHGAQLQDFVARLAVRLWASRPGACLTISVPAVDGTDTYRNLQGLQQVVSLFIVKAFDYTPYNQVVPGPLAPLKPGEMWGPHSVTTSVDYYLQRGRVPRSHLVVGFPHLAKVWQVDSVGNQLVGDNYPPVYWTNRQLRSHLPQEATKLDLTSLSQNTSALPRRYGFDPPQAWWEDSASLAPKYAWVQKEHLAGVGIWALGYDDGSPQAWNLLRASFTTVTKTAPVKNPTPLDRLYARRHVLLFSGVVLIGFLLLGLVVALFRRIDALVPNPKLLGTASLLIGLCLACIVGYLFWFGHLALATPLLVALGVAITLGLAALLYYRYWRHQILP